MKTCQNTLESEMVAQPALKQGWAQVMAIPLVLLALCQESLLSLLMTMMSDDEVACFS